ncbi:MAG: GNAT family N-acetyltransferase [Chloroflexota bacterium]
MEWRTFRDPDLPAIATLLADGLPYDRPSAADVRYLVLEDPGFDPQLIWVADHGGRIAGFAAAALPDERLQCPGGIKLFAVAPAYQRQGIASRLFDLAEDVLRAHGVSDCVAVNCGHHRLSLGLDVRYTAALCLLLRRGYEQTGTTQDMSVDLVGPAAPDLTTETDEARLCARGIAVRRARSTERRWACDGVARVMVAPTPGRRWAYQADQAFRRDPPTIEVAEDTRTGAFQGFAAYDAARRGALGPMGVAPDVRGAGLGAVLLRRCLRDMQADGYRQGEIFSVGPIPFYAKTIGARISRVFYRYAKQL